MSAQAAGGKKPLLVILSGIAIALLVAIYYSPIWWVSLTAPQYPKEAFPEGIRIHFHMNGVFNGCPRVEKKEIEEQEVLDCVHEMDAINHFVGMYPTGAGGPVEKAFSVFLLFFLGLLLIGFVIPNPKARFAVTMAGWLVMVGWMYMAMLGKDGVYWLPESYLKSLVTALGEGEEEAGEPLSPIIAKLEEELKKSGSRIVSGEEVHRRVEQAGEKKLAETLRQLGHAQEGIQVKSLKDILAEAKQKGEGKEVYIEILKQTFLSDQARLSPEERQQWNGSGMQVLLWHYKKTLARWFNEPWRNKPLAKAMTRAAWGLFWGLIIVPPILFFLGSFGPPVFYWLMGIIPALLPVAFVIEYAAWLYWFGHNMSEMGAFTLKPFMPTVFGQGKVAQFTTHSYPHYGFFLMVVFSLIVILIVLLRRKQLREEAAATARPASAAAPAAA